MYIYMFPKGSGFYVEIQIIFRIVCLIGPGEVVAAALFLSPVVPDHGGEEGRLGPGVVPSAPVGNIAQAPYQAQQVLYHTPATQCYRQ